MSEFRETETQELGLRGKGIAANKLVKAPLMRRTKNCQRNILIIILQSDRMVRKVHKYSSRRR